MLCADRRSGLFQKRRLLMSHETQKQLRREFTTAAIVLAVIMIGIAVLMVMS
jgi:hypothetical protein